MAFEINYLNGPPAVLQTKWSTTTGELLEEKMIFRLPTPANRPTGFVDSEPCRTYGHKTVSQLLFETDKYSTLHFEYDNAVDRLDFRWINCAESTNREIQRSASAYLTPNLFYRLSTMTGQVAIHNTSAGIINLRTFPLLATYVMRLGASSSWIRQQWQGATPFDAPFLHVFGDREIFGFSNAIGVQLWFFNTDFAPDFIPDGV